MMENYPGRQGICKVIVWRGENSKNETRTWITQEKMANDRV